MKETIKGYIEHIVFHNESNGYTVMSLLVDQDEVTCVGIFPELHEGEYLEADGSFVNHAVYGRQFSAESFHITIPDEGAAFERYLGSGAIRGIGEKLAARIIRHFGEDTRRILEEEPERLSEVKGISSRKAADISNQIIEKSQLQNALIFLSQYGVSYRLGIKIYKYYQDRLYSVLRENPYRLAEDIDGIGFKIADQIAARVGIRKDSEYRIKSGILYTVGRAGVEGHTYLPEELLRERVMRLLDIDLETEEKYLMDLAMEKKLILKEKQRKDGTEETDVYTSSMYYTELNSARMLCDLNVTVDTEPEKVKQKVARIEAQEKIQLDTLQKKAIYEAVRSGLLVITGGPGTGKTTTINTMIRYFISEGMEIALAAPTGRAARRMTEATGYAASTVHRLLEISGGNMEEGNEHALFERNADHPLEADVIIIDEVSMMDIYLLHALLQAIVPGTRLILVGDVNQLPSVGPGSVLKDIISSGISEVVRLTHIFRQAAESDIVMNAHRIHAGEPVKADNKSRDFFFLERSDPRIIQRVVLSLVQEKLPRYVNADSSEIQVLSPMHKGELGVDRLNQILQRYLNPPSFQKEEYDSPSGLFREGDKVMQIRNNYQAEWEIRGQYGIVGQKGMGVFNGDIGVITEINPVEEMLEVEFDEGRTVQYTFSQLDELKLAYATTIHKAQGSEYPAIVIPILSGPRMLLTRNLLYTAITRARKCVVLVGSRETFRQMIANTWEEKRYTSLADRIYEIEGQEAVAKL